jgi:hypothetical protein
MMNAPCVCASGSESKVDAEEAVPIDPATAQKMSSLSPEVRAVSQVPSTCFFFSHCLRMCGDPHHTGARKADKSNRALRTPLQRQKDPFQVSVACLQVKWK